MVALWHWLLFGPGAIPAARQNGNAEMASIGIDCNDPYKLSVITVELMPKYDYPEVHVPFNVNIDQVILSVCVGEFQAHFVDVYSVAKQIILQCETSYPNCAKIVCLHTPSAQYMQHLNSEKFSLEIYSIDWWLLKSLATDRADWQGGNSKCVALFGESAERPHKFGFVDYLDSVNKLHLFDYSMTHQNNYPSLSDNQYVEDYLNSNRNIFTDKNTEQAQSKYLELCKVFEKDPLITNPGGNPFVNSVVMYPEEFFTGSLILTVETRFIMPPGALTEKTWKPLANKMPFVALSHNDMIYDVLTRYGFKTFLEYTDYSAPAYFSHPHDEDRDLIKTARHNMYKYFFDITIKRIESFIANIPNHKDNIIQDINHNYELFCKLHHSEKHKLLDILKQTHLTNLSNTDQILIDNCYNW